ncbi:hypothetical protein EMIHUDRAFT_451080 [Emiliania huxleyi CCMP1516]|uniref:JmjC domain-containing protein n=2 Tax=Emiliania huxleyi TaxID=2903 RepID=A0A0D3J995_EMIH1|nr:hypothetical protein EMIHUDRAFT_451080 [Emiliania huxleyi CCMP1516]EOD20080.1 hypothetical protein EMIHUDRAFT_451080 [Emiliania huxleyi CCMP1516]|eukprot:XP_005772509.1 hypothetical protein EMIHUDRAFT_451080 [Emiliania huxleyi CCMP1516]
MAPRSRCCSRSCDRHAWRVRPCRVPLPEAPLTLHAALRVALRCSDATGLAAALEVVSQHWEREGGFTLTPEAASRSGGLWLLSPADIAARRRHSQRGGNSEPYDAPPYAFEVSPHDGGGAVADEKAGGGAGTAAVATEGWRAAGQSGRVTGQLSRVRWPEGGDGVPAAAARLLAARTCFVLEGARLWPAAQDKWGEPAYLAEGLGEVSCHVLSAPAQTKEFAYFLPGRNPVGGAVGVPTLAPTPRLGAAMAADLSSLRLARLRALEAAARVGAWTVCQLLHFDQYDNFYLQLAGTKTFRLFDPSQSGRLAPYPALPPRCDDARGVEVTLQPGDLLYPTSRVTTGPVPAGALAVSLNFWYSAMQQILSPEWPLGPPLRVELARQLEYLVADSFGDAGRAVPAFFRGLRAQVAA